MDATCISVPIGQHMVLLNMHGFPLPERRVSDHILARVGIVREVCSDSEIILLPDGTCAVATVTKTLTYTRSPPNPATQCDVAVPTSPVTINDTTPASNLDASITRAPPRKRPRFDEADGASEVIELLESSPLFSHDSSSTLSTDDEGDVTDNALLEEYRQLIIGSNESIIVDELFSDPPSPVTIMYEQHPIEFVEHFATREPTALVVPLSKPDPLPPGMPSWWSAEREREHYAAYLEGLATLAHTEPGLHVTTGEKYVHALPSHGNNVPPFRFIIYVIADGAVCGKGLLSSKLYRMACVHGRVRGSCRTCLGFVPCRKHYALPSACPGGCPWMRYCVHGIRPSKCGKCKPRRQWVKNRP